MQHVVLLFLYFASLPSCAVAECTRASVRAWSRTLGKAARVTPDIQESKTLASASAYWERRYSGNGTSGGGSYGAVAAWKQSVINAFVALCDLRSIAEFGFGDGNQLTMANYATYVGFDVSSTVWTQTREKFRNDTSKTFLLYDAAQNAARALAVDLVMSLDVIYHLLTDLEYEAYLGNLFCPQARWVLIYSSNRNGVGAAHVRHHRFTLDAARRFPQFELVTSIGNARPQDSHADFFIYRRRRIVATFTTFAARAPSIGRMLASVLAQTLPADEVRCYTEVPRAGFGSDTQAARLLNSDRITLRRADRELRSYKKLLPALAAEWQVDDLFFIVLDDDWVYRPSLFFDLVARHAAVGGIVVDRGRQLNEGAYRKWRMGGHDPRYPHRTVILSGSGTLVPATVFVNASVLAVDDMRATAPTADDLWWTAQAIVQNVTVSELSRAPDHPYQRMLSIRRAPTLGAENARNNDLAWSALKAYAAREHGVDLLQRALERV